MRRAGDVIAGAFERALHVSDEEMARLKDEHTKHAKAETERMERELYEAKAKVRREALAAWGVPRKDVELITGGRIKKTVALECARAFMRDLWGCTELGRASGLGEARPILVLSGRPGCGKTTAAASILLDHADRWRAARQPPLFVPVARLVRWNRFDDAAMTALERCSALVLDDLGAEYMDDKGAFKSFVDGLVNARYADWLPTVITTNCDAEKFAARYGVRTTDRLREVGRFIELPGESMRGRTTDEPR